jgi:hypothetical protein
MPIQPLKRIAPLPIWIVVNTKCGIDPSRFPDLPVIAAMAFAIKVNPAKRKSSQPLFRFLIGKKYSMIPLTNNKSQPL